MGRVATRQTGVAPAIIEHQTRRNSATTACSVWVMANPGTYRIGHGNLSIHRDAGELHHLAPFLGFVADELAELGRCRRLRDSADIAQTKSQSGKAVANSNFREDLNVDGFLDSADIAFVKSKSGTALP